MAGNMNYKTQCGNLFLFFIYPQKGWGKNYSEAAQHKAGCSIQDKIHMAGHDKGSGGS